MTATDGRTHANALIDRLVAHGDLTDEAWIAAFRATPRHLFVPRIIQFTGAGYRTLTAADGDEWWTAAYADDSLVVQDGPHRAGYRLAGGSVMRVPTSSSTMPGLMARMLETLDVHSGMSVLEIGTGTGYNAAILSARLGADLVTSIDIDPGLVTTARERLAALGHSPTIVAGDGAEGHPAGAPYDRIIATAGVSDIPLPWIDQLAPGGRLLVNLRGELSGGALCLLERGGTGAEVIGPVLPVGGHFMWMRPTLDDPHRPHELASAIGRRIGRTTTRDDPGEVPVDDEDFRFLLQLTLPGVNALFRGPTFDPLERIERPAVTVTTIDGARALAFIGADDHGAYRLLTEGSPTLWSTVEGTRRLFGHLGRPGRDRYGVVANHSVRFMWLHSDDGWYRWPLPLV